MTLDHLVLELQRWQPVVLLYLGGRTEKRFLPISLEPGGLFPEMSLEESA